MPYNKYYYIVQYIETTIFFPRALLPINLCFVKTNFRQWNRFPGLTYLSPWVNHPR